MMTWLLALFALLSGADGWTTYNAKKYGAIELNPFVRWWMRVVGVYWALLILKVGIVAAVWYVSADLGWQFVAVADAAYAVLVASNYRVLRKQQGK